MKILDLVLYRVPDVDRGPLDAPNILCKIEAVNNGFYSLSCECGILDRQFARNDFEKTLIKASIESIPEIKVSVRSVVKQISLTGGQGFIKCNCILYKINSL